MGNITSLNKQYPVITLTKFGKGNSHLYCTPRRKSDLDQVLNDLVQIPGIKKGPNVPLVILARQIDPKHILYLNSTKNQVKFKLGELLKVSLPGKILQIVLFFHLKNQCL